MFVRKHKDPLWLQIIRLILRSICLAFLGLYIFFFVGEGRFELIKNTSMLDTWCLFCVPVLFAISFMVTFFRERFGGILIVFSVILYNILSMIKNRSFSWEFEFWGLIAIGIGFIILSLFSRKYRRLSLYNRRRYL